MSKALGACTRYQCEDELTVQRVTPTGPICHELLLYLDEKDVPFERKYVDYANLPKEYVSPEHVVSARG